MWSVLGESEKWVTISESRFSGISVSESGAEVTAVGSEGEMIQVHFADPNGVILTAKCMFDSRQTLVISSSGSCI